MQRRQFIMLGLAAGATLATGLTLYPMLAGADKNQQQRDASLVLDALLPAILLGALPTAEAEQQQALRSTRQAVLDYLPFLPKRQQAELQQLFFLLSQQLTRLALTGHVLTLGELSLEQRLQLLSSWRDSYLQLLQQAYHGLRELLLAAYYGQPAHWQVLAYTAPEFRAYE